jgi:hypothetical protein
MKLSQKKSKALRLKKKIELKRIKGEKPKNEATKRAREEPKPKIGRTSRQKEGLP